MKQWGKLIAVLCLLVLGLTACQPASYTGTEGASQPQRIVSLGVSNDEMVLEMAETDRIAAISNLPSNLPEQAARVEGRATSSLESVLAYQPDLLVGAEWMHPDFIEQVRAAGIPVHLVKTPHTVAEMQQEVRALGDVLGTPSQAAQMNADIDAALERIHRTAARGQADGRIRPRIAYYSNIGITGGVGSLFDALCREMDMINVAAEAGLPDGQVLSKEQLVSLAPDLIVISGSEYDQDTYHAIGVDELMSDPSLQTVPAVANGRICVVDARHLLSLNRFILEAGQTIVTYWYGEQGENDEG